jgi:hypothetical protein
LISLSSRTLILSTISLPDNLSHWAQKNADFENVKLNNDYAIDKAARLLRSM